MLIWFLTKLPVEDTIQIRYRNRDRRILDIECDVSAVPLWLWIKKVIAIDFISDGNESKWKVYIK